jgi:hypothetical protein
VRRELVGDTGLPRQPLDDRPRTLTADRKDPILRRCIAANAVEQLNQVER